MVIGFVSQSFADEPASLYQTAQTGAGVLFEVDINLATKNPMLGDLFKWCIYIHKMLNSDPKSPPLGDVTALY